MVVSSVEAFCEERALRVRLMLGVVFRLTRASARIAVLLKRFRAGTLVWRKPVPRVRKVSAERAVDRDKLPPPSRRYPLPAVRGWLSDKVPTTAIYCSAILMETMQDPEMQALMRTTPEVARLMWPIFEMLSLDTSLLLVPEGVLPPVSKIPPRVEPVSYWCWTDVSVEADGDPVDADRLAGDAENWGGAAA